LPSLSLPVGLQGPEGKMIPIFGQGTIIPVKLTKTFATTESQKQIFLSFYEVATIVLQAVDLWQGTEEEVAKNKQLGHFVVDCDPSSTVSVTFLVDSESKLVSLSRLNPYSLFSTHRPLLERKDTTLRLPASLNKKQTIPDYCQHQ
jgi:hypothetical protein